MFKESDKFKERKNILNEKATCACDAFELRQKRENEARKSGGRGDCNYERRSFKKNSICARLPRETRARGPSWLQRFIDVDVIAR